MSALSLAIVIFMIHFLSFLTSVLYALYPVLHNTDPINHGSLAMYDMIAKCLQLQARIASTLFHSRCSQFGTEALPVCRPEDDVPVYPTREEQMVEQSRNDSQVRKPALPYFVSKTSCKLAPQQDTRCARQINEHKSTALEKMWEIETCLRGIQRFYFWIST